MPTFGIGITLVASTDNLWHLATFGVSYLSPSLFPLGIELGGWVAQHKLFASAQKTPAGWQGLLVR